MNLPSGFRFAGVASGIKVSGKKDVALIVSDDPAVAAGVYTKNIVRAASIDWNRQVTPTDQLTAVVVNSGNANACTGEEGSRNNQQMATQTANLLNCQPEQVCVMSTGVIGKQLPMSCVENGIQQSAASLGESQEDFLLASEAILTTDRGTKTASCEFEIDGQTVRIAGMAKGAGMIGPNMATMLGVVVTDAALPSTVAQDILQQVADKTFNCISVEGHTSTNDALVMMANGRSEAAIKDPKAIELFTENLTQLCTQLAIQIPADGEGATHLIDIRVSGASSDSDADTVARAVAMSNLVKTAIAGADPNWGRITSAAGLTEVRFEQAELCLSINGTPIFENGQPLEYDAVRLSKAMAESFNTLIELRLGSGSGQAQHWTSDLNEQYVRFNSLYTT